MRNKPEFKDGKLYIVRWKDAWFRTDYYNEGDDFTPMLIMDVGWVCEENEKTLVICGCLSETGEQRHITVIPWEYVIDIEELGR